MSRYEFIADICKHDDMDAAYIRFPYDTEREFGTRGQVKVTAVFDGKTEYRGSLANMGPGGHCLGIPKAIRAQIGKGPGDRVSVVVSRDLEPRTVGLPDDFGRLLEEGGLEPAFRKLSYSRQKEIIRSIEDAKKADTREKRMRNAIIQLKG